MVMMINNLTTSITKSILRYFDLRQNEQEMVLRGRPQRNKGGYFIKIKKIITNIFVYHIIMYLSVSLGVLGKAFFDLSFNNQKSLV